MRGARFVPGGPWWSFGDHGWSLVAPWWPWVALLVPVGLWWLHGCPWRFQVAPGGLWWSVMVPWWPHGRPWRFLVVPGGPWWSLVVSGGPWWSLVAVVAPGGQTLGIFTTVVTLGLELQ